MPTQDEFADHVASLLGDLGAITDRIMFGGYGIYADDRIIAIADGGALYLKADDENRQVFEDAGMPPFQPFPDRDTTMSYYRVPDEALDDPKRLLGLARVSLAAAQRSAAKTT